MEIRNQNVTFMRKSSSKNADAKDLEVDKAFAQLKKDGEPLNFYSETGRTDLP